MSETTEYERPTLERAFQDFESYIELCQRKPEQFETYRQTQITTRLSDACAVVRDALAAARREARDYYESYLIHEETARVVGNENARLRAEVETVTKERNEAIVKLSLCKIGREEAQRDLATARAALEEGRQLRWYAEWHEDEGVALWWLDSVQEPPAHGGTPLDSDWPFDEHDIPRLIWLPCPYPTSKTPTHPNPSRPEAPHVA